MTALRLRPTAASRDPDDVRWISWTIGLAGATALAVMFASQHFVYRRALGQPVPFEQLLGIELARWYLWVALAPILLAVARRYPFDAASRARILAPLGAVLAVAAAHAVVATLLDRLSGTAASALAAHTSLGTHVAVTLGGDVLAGLAIVVGYHTVAYYRRFRARQLRAAQLEMRLAQAQVQALEAQLQPHFLFNTLHAIGSLMHQDVAAADAMLSEFGELLRMRMHGAARQMVPLADELAFLERYLAIMRHRFGNRLTAAVRADDGALGAPVPNLILQPLVENAFRHGLARRRGAGCVRVEAARDNGVLTLRVSDDGPGLAPDWREGTGLATTKARLALLYGDAHEMRIANGAQGGTEVTLCLPMAGALETEV